MKKKILVISASPRKEVNSDLLCDQFISGATKAGYQIEKMPCATEKSTIVRPVTPVRRMAACVQMTTWRRSSIR